MEYNKKNNLAIFASGNGSNMQNIATYFQNSIETDVVALYCNNPNAYVLRRAEMLNIPSVIFTKKQFAETDYILKDLQHRKINWIILAGFLWLIPQHIVNAYNQRIINIHPSLLPDFGGKGMYGMHVHEAVVKQGKTESGITIHLIDKEYDKGKILFQAKCNVATNDTPADLALKIHKLEQMYFPDIIEKTMLDTIAE